MSGIVLGPCRCQGCGCPVWWDRMNWLERYRSGFRLHECRV